MNREASNIQFFFIHSHFFINSLFTLFKFCFTHKSFSPSLAIESREWKQKSQITGKTAPPNSFLWGVPQLPPLSWHLWAPVLLLPRESTVTHCSAIFLFLSTFILFSFLFFFLLPLPPLLSPPPSYSLLPGSHL